VGNVLKLGVPEDWIRTLGPRIARVHLKDYRVAVGTPAGFVPPGEGDADWPAILSALREVGYDGPLTYEGQGDPFEMSHRIDTILANS
jgi:hexulose-6-phosphate isomerase